MRTLLAFALTLAATLGAEATEVNVYSGRQEQLIKPQFDVFTREAGIREFLVGPEAQKIYAVARHNSEAVRIFDRSGWR